VRVVADSDADSGWRCAHAAVPTAGSTRVTGEGDSARIE
jgi:hypothetical protein